jgi:O-methyltransferase
MKLIQTLSEYFTIARLQKEMSAFFPGFQQQKLWLDKLRDIDLNVQSAHNSSHILQFLIALLKLPPDVPGCIIEAGAFKGGGTSKISLFAKHVNRKLFIFDSFEGLPENQEQHIRSTEGHSIKDWFKGGNFAGSLTEVKKNVQQYGSIEVCEFVPGWFEQTLPLFKEPVALAYLDVDLASSTRTCLKYLFPLLSNGGAIYSQDGDFPLVIDVLKDESFWRNEVGCKKLPIIENLGKKITIIRKSE